MHLSQRLAMIKRLIPNSTAVADIGTDHAYLPIAILQDGKASHVIASDVCEGPLLAAKRTVDGFNLHDRTELRLGNGLEVLKPGEVETVVVAGMGARTIIEIISARPDVTNMVHTFVLQPMVAAGRLRRWLVTNGFYIIEEELVHEDNRLYEIIVAGKGAQPEIESVLYEIGPVLWRKRHSLLKQHIQMLIERKEQMLVEMGNSVSARNSAKYREIGQLIVAFREKLACL